jgi:alanyl-tRNA synthetase
MVRMFDCGRCFSSHIEKKKSKCDYHFERVLVEEEIGEIQKRVNRVIQADLAVTEEYVNRGQAKERYNLDRLQENAGDPIRIIKMGDYDACPCIGPHVHSTKEIGGFRIVSTGFEDGVLRIRYRLDKSPRQ